MQRSLKDYLFITLKGIAMGAADVVPGVSGGTIAFISGIYEELISSINNITFSALKNIKKDGLKIVWKQLNGNFLLSLFVGIFISILSLAKLIKWLLENEPLLLWAFFFGLVIASIFIISKSISKWTIPVFIFIVIGAVISYYVTILEPTRSPDSFYYLFFSGFLAIIAMILPGISGAFILVLLGAYETAIGTVNLFIESIVEMNFDKFSDAILKIVSLALGALLGLKVFSKILTWMFTHKKNITLAILIGFMIGSLNKIWPWKKTNSWYLNSHDVKVPLQQDSISPLSYEGDPQLMWTIILAILGFLTIFLLEKVASKKP